MLSVNAKKKVTIHKKMLSIDAIKNDIIIIIHKKCY